MGSARKTLYTWCMENNSDLWNHVVDKSSIVKIGYASHVRIDWCCENGHIFDNEPYKYTTPRSPGATPRFSCPVCSGQRTVAGVNDICTTHPEVAKEWATDLNDRAVDSVSFGSHYMAWWRCAYGHTWRAKVYTRVWGNGCPYCSRHTRTSCPELITYLYVKKYFPDAQSMVNYNGMSLDIFIPSKMIAIEYDGSNWHAGGTTLWKNSVCVSEGIQLYVLSGIEVDAPNYICFSDINVHLHQSANPVFKAIKELLRRLGVKDIDDSDYARIYAQAKSMYYSDNNRDIDISDDIRKMWSPLNGYAIDVMSPDNENKLWVCQYGHTFERRYSTFARTKACPYCNNKRVFRYYLFYHNSGCYSVYDMKSHDMETLSTDEVIRAIQAGLNIRGLLLSDGDLLVDTTYVQRWGNASFDEFYYSISWVKAYDKSDLTQRVARYINYMLSAFSPSKAKLYLDKLVGGELVDLGGSYG